MQTIHSLNRAIAAYRHLYCKAVAQIPVHRASNLAHSLDVAFSLLFASLMKMVANEFGRLEIPSRQLTVEDVPKSGSPYDPDVVEFALTFDGYAKYGNRLSIIGSEGLANFVDMGRLPRSLDRLRACLFFQQRFWRANDDVPDEYAVRFINAILEAIRAKVSIPRVGKPDGSSAKS